jgi:DNA-binding GntR family transcriptional regulator
MDGVGVTDTAGRVKRSLHPRRKVPPTQVETSLTERAYQAIKSRLIYLDLPPGTAFTESSLANDLGFSKTPVREALARLRRDGLVEPTARSGYHVTPVTLKDARDLFALRVLLEGEAASLAARYMEDPQHLVTLDQLCRSSFDPGDSSSIKTYMRNNTELHLTVARASGNPHLAGMLAVVLDQMERLFNIGLSLTNRAEEIVHEHTDLVQAIISGDEKVAREVAVAQIHSSQRMVLDALLLSPSLLTANVVPFLRKPDTTRSRRPPSTSGR